MTKRPAFQFYPGDWRTDPGLRLCSLTARGLWMEMMAIMHEGEPYGHLTAQGRPINDDMLARLVGEAPAVVKRAMKDLDVNGVFSRTADGIIFSRRMVRDEEIREARAAGGVRGKDHGEKGASHGSKGGRPRKEKPPLGDNEGGDILPPPSSSFPSSSSSSTSDDDVDGNDLVKPGSVEEMARLIGNAAGINHNPASDPTRYTDNLAHVRDWVALGATVEMMVECAGKACAASEKPIATFRYLDQPIRQAAAKSKRLSTDRPKIDKPKPLASGGSLFQRLQSGEISQEEFDRERATMLRAERLPRRREGTRTGPIGDLVDRILTGRG